MNQLSRWGFACALAAASVCGCGNDKTFMPTPSVSAVSPALVFLGRTKDVQVSGYATMWTDTTTIDFGPGVTVNKVSAASATGVIANITVAPTAMTGPRDVTVTDGTNMEVFKGAFDVESPISVTIQGTFAQGSVAHLHLDNADHDNPFDATAIQSLFGSQFTNIAITGPMGTNVTILSVTPFSLDAELDTDVDATVGKSDLDVASGPQGGTLVHFVAPGAFDLMARTATPMQTGATQGMIASAYDSSLYTFTPPAGLQVIDLGISYSDQMAQFGAFLLPKSGHFKDGLTSGLFFTNSTDPYYIITTDTSGYSGYDYSLNYSAATATAAADTETGTGNNNQGNATAVATLPAVLQNATIMTAADEDWFKLTVPAGKMIHAIVFPGDPNGDIAVNILDKNGTDFGNCSSNFFDNDCTSPATPATPATDTYYVQFLVGASFDVTLNKYAAIIRVE